MPDMSRRRLKIYLASPLFSSAERDFNQCFCSKLETIAEVFLPQRDGLLFADLIKSSMPVSTARRMIFDVDISAILQCDIVVAVLDGRAVDEGVAFELGVGFAHEKRCLGLRTDGRSVLPSGDNPMIVSACELIHSSIEEIINSIKIIVKMHSLAWNGPE